MNAPTVKQIGGAAGRALDVATAALASAPTSYDALFAAAAAACPALKSELERRLWMLAAEIDANAPPGKQIAAYRALCAWTALTVYWACEEANP